MPKTGDPNIPKNILESFLETPKCDKGIPVLGTAASEQDSGIKVRVRMWRLKVPLSRQKKGYIIAGYIGIMEKKMETTIV